MGKSIGKWEHNEKEHKITIEYDPNSKVKSGSGKNNVIATTGGFVWDGDIGISFNIIKKD